MQHARDAHLVLGQPTNNRMGLGLLQTFLYELLNSLQQVGMRLPQNEALPEIIWHNPQRAFPGETMKAAFDAGGAHFGVRPQLIFVCLPDTGAHRLTQGLVAQYTV